MPKLLFNRVAELARLLATELANILQMQMIWKCSWSGHFWTDGYVKSAWHHQLSHQETC